MSAEFDRATSSVHLIRMGRTFAVPANDLRVGDKRLYNWGFAAVIEGMGQITDKGGPWIIALVRTTDKGSLYCERFRPSRMVPISKKVRLSCEPARPTAGDGGAR